MRVPLLLPLLQLLVISLPFISIDATQLVYDSHGKELSSDSIYYVLPANGGTGGGFIAIPSELRCLHFVSQERNESLIGTPVVFTPLNPSLGPAIRMSSDVFIEFSDLDSFCVDRLDWHLTSMLPESFLEQHKHVAAGNEDGVRSFGVFRVEKHDTNVMGYKLMSCVDKGLCQDLGLLADKGKTWLTISNKPFMVVFKEACFPHKVCPP
ncbi:unnamed protein product [Alopecurus aequalis]